MARHRLRRFKVGVQRGFFNVVRAFHSRGIDINGDHRLGAVKHKARARRRLHFALKDFVNLRLQRVGNHRTLRFVKVQAVGFVRMHQREEVAQLLKTFGVVAGDGVGVRIEVIARRAHENVVLAVDERRALFAAPGFVYHAPQFEQVGFQIPRQRRGVLLEPGGAHDNAHVLRHRQLGDQPPRLLARVRVAAARNMRAPAAHRVQHQVASGEGDESRQPRALAAGIILLDLHEDAVALVEGAVRSGRARQVGGDILEGEEAVFVVAEVHESGVQPVFNADDDGFVDVSLAVFAPGDFLFKAGEDAVFNDDNAAFFGLFGVDVNMRHCVGVVREPAAPPTPAPPRKGRRKRRATRAVRVKC